jgi:primosomal protein N' (replication factor Y)
VAPNSCKNSWPLLADVRGPTRCRLFPGEPARRPHRRRQHPAQGSLQTQLAEVHAGEVDVLVGTQMMAKGHDFRRITLVAAVNPDGALFSSDFRAPSGCSAC